MSQLADDSAVRVAIDAREKARRDQIRADVYRRATAPTVNSQRTDTVPDRPGFPGYGNAMAQQSAPPAVDEAEIDRRADSLYQQDVRARIAQVEARMATKIKATVDEVVQPRPGEDPRATEARRQNQLNWVLQQKGIAPISMPDRPVGELGMMNEAGRSALRFGYSTVGALAGSLPEMAGTVGQALSPPGSPQRAGFGGLQRGGRYVRETMGEGAAGFPPSDSVTMQGFLPDNAGSVPRWLAARGPEAVGSVGVSLLPGIGIGGKLGAAAAMATGTAMEAGTTYDDAYRSLVAQGVPPDQAAKHATVEASIYGAVSGALEKFPAAEFILKDRTAMSRVLRAARGAFIEGSTESAQELAQGLTQTIGGSAPDAMDEIGSRMAASGILGAIPGGGLGMVTGGNHEALPQKQGQTQTQTTVPPPPTEPLSEVDQARAMVNAGKLTPEQAAHLAELIRQVEAEEQTPPPAPVVSTPVAAPVPTQGDRGGAAGQDATATTDVPRGNTETGVVDQPPPAPPVPTVDQPARPRFRKAARGEGSDAQLVAEIMADGGDQLAAAMDDAYHPMFVSDRAAAKPTYGTPATWGDSGGRNNRRDSEAIAATERMNPMVRANLGSEDVVSTMGGVDEAVKAAEYAAGGDTERTGRVLSAIRRGAGVSPQAAVNEYTIRLRDGGPTEQLDAIDSPAGLPEGTTFAIAGRTHEVVTDADGRKVFHEATPDATPIPLEGVRTLRVDRGTLDPTGANRGDLDARAAAAENVDDLPFSLTGEQSRTAPTVTVQPKTAAERQAVEVGKALGLEVQLFDGGDAAVNGVFDPANPQRLQIRRGEKSAVRRVLTHEWTHSLRQNARDAYDSLVSAIKRADPEGMRQFAERYKQMARDAGMTDLLARLEADPSLLEEEAVAEMLAHHAGTAGFWSALARENASVWDKIVDALRRIVTRLGLRGGVARELLRTIEKATAGHGKIGKGDGGVRLSIDQFKMDFGAKPGEQVASGRQSSLFRTDEPTVIKSNQIEGAKSREQQWAEAYDRMTPAERKAYKLRHGAAPSRSVVPTEIDRETAQPDRKVTPAERNTGKLFSLSDRAAKQAQQTATGKEPVEDPRGRVNPGKSPGGKRAIDALREALQQFNPPASRPDAAIRTEAARKLAKDYAGERARLIDLAGKGGMPTDTDMRTMRSISVHEAAVALRSNTPQAWQAATEAQHAYDRFGAMASRAFAQRQVHLGGKRTHAELMQETLVHDLLAPSHQFAADTARHEKAMAKLEQERDSLRSKLEAAEKAAEKSGAENEAARAELQKRLKQLDRRESDLKAMKERAMKAEAELNARIARDLAKFNIDVTTPIAAAAREVAGDVRAASGAGPAPTNYKGQTDLAGHEESGALTVKNGPDTPRLEGTGVDKFGVGLQKNIPGMDGTFEGTDGPKGVADEATHLRLLMAAMRGRRIVQAAKGNVWDRFYEFWVNGLISGVRTIGINISTNTVYGAYSTFGQRFADAMVNLALGPNPLREGATLSEFSAMARTIAPALRKAWLNAVDTFRNEMPVFEDEINWGQGLTTHAVERTVAIPGKLGRGVRVPSRVSMMADEFNKTLWGTLHAAALAHRHASTEGLKGDALWNRVGELMGDISHPLWFAALHEAKRVTFQEDLERLGLFGKMAHGVTSLRNAVPGVRYLFPFVRTPTNLVFTGLGHTPLASAAMLYKLAHDGIVSIRKGASGDYYYRGNRSALANDISRNLVAWGMFLALGSLAAGDDKDGPYITGTNQLAPGIPKTSIRIGGKWYNYGYLEPMASMLSLTVDLSNNLMRGGPRTALRGVTDSISDTANRLSDSVPMLTGIANISDLIESMRNRGSAGAHQSAVRWAGQFTASWVPNFIRSGLQAADPNVRDYRTLGIKGDSGAWGGFTRTVAYRALGRLSPLDPPSMKYDLWGRAVQRDAPGFGPVSDWAFRVLSPASGTPRNIGTEARMDRLIMNWNQRHPDVVFAPKPPDPFFDKGGKSVPMTEREWETLQHESGRAAVMRLGRMRLNDAKPTATDIKDIQNEISRARREVRDRLWASRERAKS